jgi:hypothetical protein
MVKKDLNAWNRWLHIYLSMFSFAMLFFFAVTGITLNHPSWLEDQQKVEMLKGEINPAWVSCKDTASVAKLDIVEYFREKYSIRARLTDFRIEDYECSVSFNGPGYTADGFIDRSIGSYEFTVTTAGYIAVLNDLHKGRDTGGKWAVIIDISAILMVAVSMTGFIMIFFLTKRKSKGIWVSILGAATFVLLYLIFV